MNIHELQRLRRTSRHRIAYYLRDNEDSTKGALMNGEGQTLEQGPVSVDGAWYALVDGEWMRVPPPRPAATIVLLPIPHGYVSIDGAWFGNLDGRLAPAASAIPARLSRSRPVPEEYVSVDGALFRVEAEAEPADVEAA